MNHSERGLGLIEVLVVAALLTLALTVFGTAFGVMVNTSHVSRAVGDVTDQARLSLNELERQVRFGYWVRPLSCGVDCDGVKVLTQDVAGERQCWAWVLNEGRLITFHRPALLWAGDPALSDSGWQVAAEGVSDASTLEEVAASEVRPLDGATFERVSYWTALEADLYLDATDQALQSPLPPANISFQVTVRNPWVGASFSEECDA